MKIVDMRFLLSFLIILMITGSAFALQTGDEVPGFSVVSGKGQILIRNDINDKKVILFYEDRSQITMNQELKDYLKSLSLDRDEIMTVAVVDCSNVGVFKKVWQDRLEDHARKNRLAVYGDWNGKMKKNFGYPDNTSTFMIIDEAGQVVYSKAGVVSSSEFAAITDLVQ